MPGLYIPLYTKILTEPKISRLCRMLGKNRPDDRDLIRAKVENLWLWAIEHCQDGDVGDYSSSEIAEFCRYRGNSDKWLKALIECGTDSEPGFLERTDDGSLILHNWESYGGKIVKERERVNAKQKRYRYRNGSGNADSNRYPPEKIREEKNRSCKSEQPDFLDESSSEEKEAAPKTDPLEIELFGEDGNSGLWYVWPSARRESKKAVYAAFKAARKRADYPTILSSAKAYCSSPYVSSRIEMKEFSTIKTLPAWLNSDLWERDPASFQEPCQAWKAKYGLNGSANKPAERSPEDKTRSRIDYHAKLAQEKFAEGNDREQVISMLRRCALGEEEILPILELAQKSTV